MTKADTVLFWLGDLDGGTRRPSAKMYEESVLSPAPLWLQFISAAETRRPLTKPRRAVVLAQLEPELKTSEQATVRADNKREKKEPKTGPPGRNIGV